MKTVEEAVGFFHSLERFGVNPGLERIGALCEILGHPEKCCRYVHVAGTNGKGSVCTEISNILREAGFVTGLYTSPYVLDFRERIQVNNRMISAEDLISAAQKVKSAVETLNARGVYPTEFEAVTAAAFLHFANAGCKIVVLETGLGGRFDATNIIEAPIVSVITSISLDHVKILGDTLAKIAFEKSGIIKPLCHTVTDAANPTEALNVIRETAAQRGSYLFEASPDALFQVISSDITGTEIEYRGVRMRIPFPGAHQIRNAALALKACEVIGVSGFDLTVKHIKSGLEASFIPARIEIMHGAPPVILDGSHNDDSTLALAAVLRTYLPNIRILAVMGMMEDKDCGKAVRNLQGCFTEVIAVTPSNPRAMPAEKFRDLLTENGYTATAVPDPLQAVDRAFSRLAAFDALVVCGSLYLASDVRAHMLNKISSI